MSYPKRYSPFYTLRNGDGGMASFGVEPRNDGVYVEHSEYWKLFEEVTRLKAHIELLTDVGDAMAMMVGHIEVKGDAHRMMLEFSNEWNAAKEGKGQP